MNYNLLLEKFLQSENAYEIYCQLEGVRYLLLNYGKKLKDKAFLQGIEEFNKELYDLIKLIDLSDLLEIKKISGFIRDFKIKLSNKLSLFDLKSNTKDIIPVLEKFLGNKFGECSLSFEEVESDNIMINVSGNGYAYKRSLDSDIDRLLD